MITNKKMTRAASLLAVCLSSVALACTSKSEKRAAPSQPKAARGSETTKFENERLALDAPAGESSTDRMVRERQAAVKKLRAKPDNWVLLGRAWVRKARASSDPGFYLNAKAAAQVALQLQPENRLAKNLIGIVHLNNHDFVSASRVAKEIIAGAPQDAMAHGTLSDALLELGDYEGAMAAAQKMNAVKPDLPSYARLSYLKWVYGEGAAAKEAIRLAFDAGRGQRDREPATWALTEAAHLFWHEGDFEGAKAGYTLALRYYTDYPAALVGMGRIHMAEGAYGKAVTAFEKAFSATKLARTAWLLGDAKSAAGDHKGAQAAYAEVERIGRLSDRRTLVAYLATKNRSIDRAVEIARKESKSRASIDTLDGLAWALYRKGDLTGASDAIEKATRLGTRSAEMLYHLGAIQIAKGEVTQGKKNVAEALKLNPKFDWTGAKEARALLDG